MQIFKHSKPALATLALIGLTGITTINCSNTETHAASNTLSADTVAIAEDALPQNKSPAISEKTFIAIDTSGKTLSTRFNVPAGYKRIKCEAGSFGEYLRNLPLKPHGTLVKMFDGDIKYNDNVYNAVVDLPIGTKDLHQCADAVMRLRAEYLWKNKQYDKIHFNFTNGFRVDYSEWMKGKRMIVKGNKTYWSAPKTPSNTYKDFWNYMELIFSYAGTYSLDKELKQVDIDSVQNGDVFIRGGFPGHAVIVVDVAEHVETKKKIFMVAQSYMPAQELQILSNQYEDDIAPWYTINYDQILTPEWTFEITELKRFEE